MRLGFGSRYTATLIIFNSLQSAKSFQLGSKRNIGNFLSQNRLTHPIQNVGISRMSTFKSTSTETAIAEISNKYNFSWQQVMLRIKDPKLSVPFYEEHFGFKLVHFYNFPQWNFSLYFLAFIPDEETFDLIPGTAESEKYLWSSTGM